MPSTRSAWIEKEVLRETGLTVGLWGKMAELTEQNAMPQFGAIARESVPLHAGQPLIPPMGTVSPGSSHGAIGIANATAVCPAYPMPRATSRTSERRRARNLLMTAELALAAPGFKPVAGH